MTLQIREYPGLEIRTIHRRGRVIDYYTYRRRRRLRAVQRSIWLRALTVRVLAWTAVILLAGICLFCAAVVIPW